MSRLMLSVFLSLLHFVGMVRGILVCDKFDNMMLNDTKRLVYIRQGENMRNVDLSYRDFTIGTNAIVQKETVVPFRRQWFYMVPCTTDKVQFVTYKKARALAAFPQTSNSDGSYNLTCNASQIGAEEQLFGITPEGVIYNEGSTGIRILSTMNNVESTQGQVHLTLLTVSTVPNELITWRVTPVNPATAPQMPTGPTLPELIARLKSDSVVPTMPPTLAVATTPSMVVQTTTSAAQKTAGSMTTAPSLATMTEAATQSTAIPTTTRMTSASSVGTTTSSTVKAIITTQTTNSPPTTIKTNVIQKMVTGLGNAAGAVLNALG